MNQFKRRLNPFATWVVALSFLIAMFGGVAQAAAQDNTDPGQESQTAGNGVCEGKKSQWSYYVYEKNEDETGYPTNLPQHPLWERQVGKVGAFSHDELYLGPGLGTFSVMSMPLADGETPRTSMSYGSDWKFETSDDCKKYDVVADVERYMNKRDKRGHTGIWVLIDNAKGTAIVTQFVPSPDERIYTIARDQVPAYLAEFNNAPDGKTNLFDGLTLTWWDTGEVINLPSSNGVTITGNGSTSQSNSVVEEPGTGTSTNGGGQLAASTCTQTQPTPLDDLEGGSVGVAPTRPEGSEATTDNPGLILMVDAWSNQWDPNLSPQKKPGANEDEKQFGEYILMIRPTFHRWDELWGLQGAVYAWDATCEARAVADYNNKSAVRRITINGYLKWVQDPTQWPSSGAEAKVA